MSQKLPSFQFYPGDYLSDPNVVMMTPEERGGYIHLLCHAWKNSSVGYLPNDDKILASLSDLRERWKDCREGIFRAFQIDTEFIVQKRLVREIAKYERFSKKQSANAKKGVEKRRSKSNTYEPPLNLATAKTSLSSSSSLSVTEAKAVTPLFGNIPEVSNKENLGRGIAASRPRVPHQEIVDYYFQKFFEATGERMHVDGKVGELVKKLLKTFPETEKLKGLIDSFFASDDDFIAQAGRDFGVFYSQVNKLMSRHADGGGDLLAIVKRKLEASHGRT